MKNNNAQINSDEFGKINEHLKIPYSKTKAEVWAEMESKLTLLPVARKTSLIMQPSFRLAVAAMLVLMLGIAGFMRYYTVTTEILPGNHQLVSLPDGSTIQLNAGSEIQYHKYWWRFSRSVSFRGEGFFKVEKGSPFTVISEKGKTSVLGTSFNIYSRDNEYRVACLTGKVMVTDPKNLNKVILEPNQKAELNQNGTFNVQQNINPETETAWIHNKFLFTAAPLTEVLTEIERQFNVRITWAEGTNTDQIYTGYFDRNQNIEEVLGYVCKPFGIKYKKIKNNEFQLSQNP